MSSPSRSRPPSASSSIRTALGGLVLVPVFRALLLTLQLAAIGWFSPGRGLPLDDAWIHQVVARTFAETGTLGYAPGQHGAAATSYLWAAALALNFKIAHLDASLWALLLNGLSAIVTGQLLFTLLLRARSLPETTPSRRERETLEWRLASFLLTLLACVSPNILWFTCSGMEAMPLLALSLGAITAATDRRADGRSAVAAGIAAGALALLRPEAMPLGGLLATWMLVRQKSLRRAILVAVPWAAMFAIYGVSNVLKTGHILPSTLAGRRWLWFATSVGLSRGERALDFLDLWATRLGTYTLDTSLAVTWTLTAIGAYGALRLAHPIEAKSSETKAQALDRAGVQLVFAWAICHASFYALLLPTPGHGGRYQPFTPLLFCVCVPLGAAFLLGLLGRMVGVPSTLRAGWLVVLLVVPLVALGLPGARTLREANALAVAHIRETEIGAGKFVSQLPDGVVASFDIGGIGWASPRRVLDLGGLSDAKTAAALEEGRVSEWLESNRVRWLVLPETTEPVLPVFDDFRSRLHIRDNPAIELEPIREFETPVDKWGPAIAATWNAAPKQVVYEVHYTSRPGSRAMPPIDASIGKPIGDPLKLAPRVDRAVTEHTLAVLAAWGMNVDVRLTDEVAPSKAVSKASEATAADTSAKPMTGSCAVRLGWWGFAIDGCDAIADPALLRSMAYEQAGRYIDEGDLGGALRAIPHVLAQARRRTDPLFSPPLAPLMPPTRGGNELGPTRAGATGLFIVFGVVVIAALVDLAGRRDLKIARLVTLVRAHLPAKAATMIFVGVALLPPSVGCAPPSADVNAAILEGRGAVEHALDLGGAVNPQRGPAPLLHAAAAGDAEIVSLLLDRGARTDVQAPDGATALHLAVRHAHAAVATLLLVTMRSLPANEGGRPPLIEATAGPRRRTALHDAVTSGSVDCVAALVEAGADVDAVDSFEQTPLHLLGTVDPSRAARIAPLLQRADARMRDARGFTPLHSAAVTDNIPVLASLATDASSNTHALRTPSGETALDLAIRYRRDLAAERLLRSGSLLERPHTLPPLHDAARMDAIERAAVLVANGADLDRKFDGRTALDVAHERASKRVEALLRARAR